MKADDRRKVSELYVFELEQLVEDLLSSKIQNIQSQTAIQNIISIEEAMEITHLAKQTIYGLVFEKRIPFIKRPRSKKLFFSRTALNEWMIGR